MFTPDTNGLICEYLFEAPSGSNNTIVRNTANPGVLDGSIVHNADDYPLSVAADAPDGFPNNVSLDYNVLRTLLNEGTDPDNPGDQRGNAQYVEISGFPDLTELTLEAWVKVDYAKTPGAFQVPAPGTYSDGEIGFGACPQPICLSNAWYLFLSTLQTDRNLILTIIGDNVTQGLPKSADSDNGSGGVVSADIVPGGNQWTHIAATVGPYAGDSTKNVMRVYINGVESYQEMVTDDAGVVHNIPRVTDNTIDTSTNSLLRLGIFRTVMQDLDYQYSGRMCGVRIYSRALTRAQICADIAADTATPEIVSYPPSINFGEVAEGLITTRPISVSVRGCVNTRVNAGFVGSSGPFSFPLGDSDLILGSGTHDQINTATIWLAYTAGAAGTEDRTTIQIDVPDAGFSEQIDIVAISRVRPSASIVLALDRSASMNNSVGIPGVTKIDSLRQAARTFVNLMREGDQIGIVRYNQNAPAPHFALTDVGPEDIGTGRNAATNYIDSTELNPAGATSIGDGVFESGGMLLGSSNDVQAMVVMTDGIENRDRRLSDPDVRDRLGNQTYAVGLGSPANISTGALNAITSGSGKYLLVTGEIDVNSQFRLIKYFTQILSDIDNMDIVVDPDGVVTTSRIQKVPFSINETDIEIDVVLLSPQATQLYFAIQAPDGTIIDHNNVDDFPNVQYIVKEDVAYFRIRTPIFLDSTNKHIGVWQAGIGHLSRKQSKFEFEFASEEVLKKPVPYSFLVRSRSNFKFDYVLTQPDYAISSPFLLDISMQEYGIPVNDRFNVVAQITKPNGGEQIVPLIYVDSGRYHASLPENTLTGSYTVRVKARGTTLLGNLVEREKTLTGIVLNKTDITDQHSQNNVQNRHIYYCCSIVSILLIILILVQLLI